MTGAMIAKEVRRIQLDLAWTVERLNEYFDALHQDMANAVDRIESALPDGWRDRCSADHLLVIEEAKDTLRQRRGPLDEAIRDTQRVLHLVDELDKSLLAYVCGRRDQIPEA